MTTDISIYLLVVLNHTWTSVSLDLISAWKETVGGILGEAEQQCVGALFRHSLAPRQMAELLHRLQTTLSSVSLGFIQSFGIEVELHLPRGHPKLFFGLNEQVIIGYLI